MPDLPPSRRARALFPDHVRGCLQASRRHPRPDRVAHDAPWKPVPGFGSFLESRRLSDTEVATILKWIDAGAPEGDRAKLPPPRVFPTGWALGPPDHVLEMSAPYTVPA